MDQMNSTLTKPLKQIKEKSRIVSKITSIINTIGFARDKDRDFTFSDHVFYLLRAAENSDPKTKSRIENHLVKMGEEAASLLVQSLMDPKSSSRGLAAMALIRIGTPSINYLEQRALKNPEFRWISEYIIGEIKGSGIELDNAPVNKELEGVLAG